VGFGSDVTIQELANTVAKVTSYQGKIVFDSTRPDGAPRKWMDSGRLNRLGWHPKVSLEAGLKQAYSSFQQKT
jgi:GDP-L-fucose synthase